MTPEPPVPEVTLDNVGADVEPARPGSITADEERKFFQHSRSRLVLKAFGQDLDERKKYAGLIFWLVAIWLFLIAVLLGLQGFGEVIHFHLSDQIILTVIGAATIKLLGILYVITKYLFPQRLTVVEEKNSEDLTE